MNKRTRFTLFIGVLLTLVCLISFAAVRVERGDRIFLDTVTFAKVMKCSLGNGSAVSGTSSAVEYGNGILHKTVLTISKTITQADTDGSGGYGSAKIYDFPSGAIQILGSETYLTASAAGGSTHGLVANADGDYGIGTAACNAGSLATTECDITASTSLAQFANTAGIIQGTGAVGSAALDGTTTAKDAYLNIIFDDADSSGADDIAVAGTIILYWINLGDLY